MPGAYVHGKCRAVIGHISLHFSHSFISRNAAETQSVEIHSTRNETQTRRREYNIVFPWPFSFQVL